jgi:DNA-cytosine methyltransferase
MNTLDLFSGIGGFSLGLERAGMKTVAFCEYDEHAQRVLEKHWPDVPIYEDVRVLDGRQYKGAIDLVCGGFPCQDISIAGKNAGIDGEKSGLWKEFKRIIEESEAKYCLIENVSALLSRGLNVILNDLAEIGYDATWTTLDTKFFGLPQRRRRVYILGVRNGIKADADIFKLNERSTKKHRDKVAPFQKSFKWDFTKREGEQDTFAFFTRQRSDQFAETGLSGTLAKRDYKSFTDLVLQKGFIRRVTPKERLLLQGFPIDWFEGVEISDSTKFTFNGMSTTVVHWIGEQIMEYDNV